MELIHLPSPTATTFCSERIEQVRGNDAAKPADVFRLFRDSIPITPDHIHHVTRVGAVEVRAV